MKKFHDFSISQILREIKTGESRGAKPAIFTHLMALNFDFYEFLQFLKAEIYQINKIQCPEYCTNGSFTASRFFKIDFKQKLSDIKIKVFLHCTLQRHS